MQPETIVAPAADRVGEVPSLDAILSALEPMGSIGTFVAATDENGLPNPSMCGEIDCKFGPLDLGSLHAQMSCRDCVTGILRDFYKLALCLGEPVVRQLASNAAPRLASLNLPPEQLLNQMSDVEKIGFMAEIYKMPPGTFATELAEATLIGLKLSLAVSA